MAVVVLVEEGGAGEGEGEVGWPDPALGEADVVDDGDFLEDAAGVGDDLVGADHDFVAEGADDEGPGEGGGGDDDFGGGGFGVFFD